MDGMEAGLACFVRQSQCCSFVLVIFLRASRLFYILRSSWLWHCFLTMYSSFNCMKSFELCGYARGFLVSLLLFGVLLVSCVYRIADLWDRMFMELSLCCRILACVAK